MRLRWLAVAALVVAAGAGGWLASSARDDAPSASSYDVAFLRDMADHHDQAVQLALIELSNGEAEVLKGFAVDVIASQRHEIGLMEARLVDWGHGRGQRAGGHRHDMPGMATQDQIADFAAARGRAADERFVRLMTAHHEGGVRMAEEARRRAGRTAVRRLADRIAKLQLVEIRDLQRLASA